MDNHHDHHLSIPTTLDPHHNHNHVVNTTMNSHENHTMSNTSMQHVHDTSMDHSNHNTMSAHQMMMMMHTGFKEIIVFESWTTNNIGSLIGSCLALMLIAIAYEGLKLLRDKITQLNLIKSKRQKLEIQNSSNSNVMKFSIDEIPKKCEQTYFEKLLSVEHLIQTILHILQFAISYFIMLAFMTYNYWICMCILIGIGIGFFFFGVRRNKIDLNEDCH